MTLLVIGIALWSGAHLLKRLAPGLRAGIEARLGAKGARGIVALGIALGLILMIFGYRGADFVPVYTPPAWTVHLNNLAMLGAVALMGMGQSKGRARSWLRHPMLTGVSVWAVAHLLVNGDLASLLLFGGLGLWAVASMLVINAREPVWERPAPGPAKGDLRLIVITIVVFVVIAVIHSWLGYWPFPR